MAQPLIELSGKADAPLLHMMPANGFPPETYLPLLRQLSGFRSICLPPRALWVDEPPPAVYRSWNADASDLLSGLEQRELRDVVLIGHSLGGVVSLLALLQAPERFKALVMLDPVILPQQALDMLGWAWQSGAITELPLVAGALRRRSIFTSREDAYRRFRDKAVFADWGEEALRLYVKHGLRRREDDAGYELCWSTTWEAHYFSTVYRDIWQDLPKLNGLAPTLIMRATYSDTFPVAEFVKAQALLPNVAFHEMKGEGHLFPQASPLETARVIQEWLNSQRLP